MKKPDAVTILSYENFKEKTYSLPITSIIGIGRQLEKKLNKMNIYTLKDLADFDVEFLKKRLGIVGEILHNRILGIDDDEIASTLDKRQIKSVGNGTTTIVDIKTKDEMKSVVMFLCEEIAFRLRKKKLVGSTIHVSLKKEDLTYISKSYTISTLTNTAKDIFNITMEMIAKMWNNYSLIRSVRISVSNLADESMINQLDLFNTKNKKQNLNKAIDKIREKYGYQSISPLITKNSKLINNDIIRLDNNE